ncbi:MAG: DUF1385 domain-containing protein [Ruminococcaceae bacterium]|nr:DUF1385 domain-containing protein [Oscillospiraceae bacterium]
MSEQKKTMIGGQALIEGIVMRGRHVACMALRLPDGEIELIPKKLSPLADKNIFFRFPIVRGIVGFIEALIFGYNCLIESAEKTSLEEIETKSKFEKWIEKRLGDKMMKFIGVVSAALGIILSLLLFMYLPAWIVDMMDKWVFDYVLEQHKLHPLFEGVIKIFVFVIYLWAVSKMQDIKRTFMYHGAEHKTIFCYENGVPLTVENVRIQSRFHPRCGTSFMFVMMIISIFISTILIVLFPWLGNNRALWVFAKLLVLPLIMGIGYEFIKYAGRKENFFIKIFSAPGLWMQRISTVEPTDDMIEIAIFAFEHVLENEPDLDIKIETKNRGNNEKSKKGNRISCKCRCKSARRTDRSERTY